MAEVVTPAIHVNNLTFSLFPGGPELLKNVSLDLPAGARCVVIGANGAGKSTLLELLAGKKMAPAGCVKVMGVDPFRGSSGQSVALVQGVLRAAGETGTDFRRVWQMLGLEEPASSEEAPSDNPMPAEDARYKELLEMLGLGRLLHRYMGSISDGERRRVELGRKLRDPCAVLLLDEATTDLDLLVRQRLLDFLKKDGSTVLTVTHVFDGLCPWATHVLHVHEGQVARCEATTAAGGNPWEAAGGLFHLAVRWIFEAMSDASPPQLPEFPIMSAEGGLDPSSPAIQVRDLTFAYAQWAPLALRLDELTLHGGCRCVLVGLNGSGKSTLLSILAGRRLVSQGEVHVLGQRAFHEHAKLDPQVAILSSEWKRQVAEISAGRAMSFKELAGVVMQDLVAAGLDMALLAGRMLRLTQMLAIDPTKQLGCLSDGMMRRVQIALKLLRPSNVLFVDEVTADLDVLARRALLDFLQLEAGRGCAVLYCTHILDGLQGWADSLLWVRPGGLTAELVELGSSTSPPVSASSVSASLFQRVLSMLREDEAVPPAPVPEVRTAGDTDASLPSGWRDRGTTHAGAYGSYAWNTERGPEETWSFGSVAPETSNEFMQGGQGAHGAPAAGAAFPQQQAPNPGFGGPSMAGRPEAFQGVPGRPGGGDPFGFGFFPRGNTMPVQDLVARGVLPPQ